MGHQYLGHQYFEHSKRGAKFVHLGLPILSAGSNDIHLTK